MKTYKLKRNVHAQIDSDVGVTVGSGSIVRGDAAGPNYVIVEVPISSAAAYPCQAMVHLTVTINKAYVEEIEEE